MKVSGIRLLNVCQCAISNVVDHCVTVSVLHGRSSTPGRCLRRCLTCCVSATDATHHNVSPMSG